MWLLQGQKAPDHNTIARFRYECFECDACPYKDKCTKAKGNRRLYVSKKFIKYREKSHLNISTSKGELLRMNRSIQVEGAFGVLKQDYSFRRFLLRGKKNIKIEFMLLCFAYDIKKLFNKTLQKVFQENFYRK